MSRKSANRVRIERMRRAAAARAAAAAEDNSAVGSSKRGPVKPASGAIPRQRPVRRSAPPPPRRFRSQSVAIGAGGALIAALVGVGIYQNSHRTCVDRATQTVVDASQCRTTGHGASWYYGGRGGGIGSKVTGGSYERGGFGRFFSGGG